MKLTGAELLYSAEISEKVFSSDNPSGYSSLNLDVCVQGGGWKRSGKANFSSRCVCPLVLLSHSNL